MPVGPIGLLCIKNTLTHGFKIGFAVGLGAALADSFYGFLAGGGLAIFSGFLLDYSFQIKLVGAVALIYLGVKEIIEYKNSPSHAAEVKTSNFSKTILAVFFLTLTNPATIIAYLAIFTALGGSSASGVGIFIMILGVFFGSLFWWLILAFSVSKIKHKISPDSMHKIKIFSGIILCAFGIYSLIN